MRHLKTAGLILMFVWMLAGAAHVLLGLTEVRVWQMLGGAAQAALAWFLFQKLDDWEPTRR